MDPDCTSPIEQAWGDLYPLIVKQEDGASDVTFYPEAIPPDRTLVLAAEWDTRRPDRPPLLVVRVMMVRGPAPACVGEIFKRVKPLERFTACGRRVVDQAREEARELGHRNIGPEHILIGLLREQEGLAAKALGSLNVTLELVRVRVAQTAGSSKSSHHPGPGFSAPLTPRAMHVLQRAPLEATSLGSDRVASEHVLLALVGEHEGVAARILRECGVDAEMVREEVIRLTGSSR